ncbi:N-acetyltransferase [Rhizophlyctis rosea]|uniref:Glucosamine 6-phosphate N-acetyltransferase n=1 Tax=Rhizophlyctis rosea TaxID=64517 RepID=A0AAD5X085_9FUNG|nr:N-acetyltransferase [Rhizophlyctis rosea]
MGSNTAADTPHPSNATDFQFPDDLISEEVQQALPPAHLVRPLHIDDHEKGFLPLLGQLSSVGNVTKEMFRERFHWLQQRNDTHYTLVIEDVDKGKVVGAGSLLLDHKFLHENGIAAHIEDIVVDEETRGKSLGKWIIKALVHIADERKAYKVILNCAQDKIGFYEKCGFKPKSTMMASYRT